MSSLDARNTNVAVLIGNGLVDGKSGHTLSFHPCFFTWNFVSPPTWFWAQPMKWSEVKWCRSVMSKLCDPMDCSLPGSLVHGIVQARVLEWVAISFSRGSSQPRDWTQDSRIVGRHFTTWATREAPANGLSEKCDTSRGLETCTVGLVFS